VPSQPSSEAGSDTESLIETGVRRFLEEVPALEKLKLVLAS
jgi:hypothetical protein